MYLRRFDKIIYDLAYSRKAFATLYIIASSLPDRLLDEPASLLL